VTVSHPPGGRLPLLSVRPVVTSPAVEHHRPLAGTKLKPNSITLAGSKLVRSWSQTGSKLSGSKLVADRFEAGRTSEMVCDQLRTSLEPDSVMEFGFYTAW